MPVQIISLGHNAAGLTNYDFPTQETVSGVRIAPGQYQLKDDVCTMSLSVPAICLYSPNRFQYVLRSIQRVPADLRAIAANNLKLEIGGMIADTMPQEWGRYAFREDELHLFQPERLTGLNNLKALLLKGLKKYGRKEMKAYLTDQRPVITHELGHRFDFRTYPYLPQAMKETIERLYRQGLEQVIKKRPWAFSDYAGALFGVPERRNRAWLDLLYKRINPWFYLPPEEAGPLKQEGNKAVMALGKRQARRFCEWSYPVRKTEIMAEMFRLYVQKTVDGVDVLAHPSKLRYSRERILSPFKPLFDYLSQYLYSQPVLLKTMAERLTSP